MGNEGTKSPEALSDFNPEGYVYDLRSAIAELASRETGGADLNYARPEQKKLLYLGRIGETIRRTLLEDPDLLKTYPPDVSQGPAAEALRNAYANTFSAQVRWLAVHSEMLKVAGLTEAAYSDLSQAHQAAVTDQLRAEFDEFNIQLAAGGPLTTEIVLANPVHRFHPDIIAELDLRHEYITLKKIARVFVLHPDDPVARVAQYDIIFAEDDPSQMIGELRQAVETDIYPPEDRSSALAVIEGWTDLLAVDEVVIAEPKPDKEPVFETVTPPKVPGQPSKPSAVEWATKPVELEEPELDEGLPWDAYANCLGVDPDLFFPERGASTREAKEVCRGCSVRPECLEFALANGERFGIWGGMSERERRRIRRKRAQEAGQPIPEEEDDSESED